jgi:hypothetical protein
VFIAAKHMFSAAELTSFFSYAESGARRAPVSMPKCSRIGRIASGLAFLHQCRRRASSVNQSVVLIGKLIRTDNPIYGT